MRLPVDTSSIAFLCALEPQPVLAFLPSMTIASMVLDEVDAVISK
jgi:hypothetical protein